MAFGIWLVLAVLSGIARADESPIPVDGSAQQGETVLTGEQEGTSGSAEVDAQESAIEPQVTTTPEAPSDPATTTTTTTSPLAAEPAAAPQPAPVPTPTTTSGTAPGSSTAPPTGTSTGSPTKTVAATDPGTVPASSTKTGSTSPVNETPLPNAAPTPTVAATSCGTTAPSGTRTTYTTGATSTTGPMATTPSSDSTGGTLPASEPTASAPAACAPLTTGIPVAPAPVTAGLPNRCVSADQSVDVLAAALRCAATAALVTSSGAVPDMHTTNAVAGVRVLTKVSAFSAVRPPASLARTQTQAGMSAVPHAGAPPLSPPERPAPPPPTMPTPALPLPAPTTMTGGTSGVAGSGRADQARGGDSWDALTPGQPTPDGSTGTLSPTLTFRAHPISGADEPAVQPD
jgi:hypothetical protein